MFCLGDYFKNYGGKTNFYIEAGFQYSGPVNTYVMKQNKYLLVSHRKSKKVLHPAGETGTISAYNNVRLHASCDYITPSLAHGKTEPLARRWKHYKTNTAKSESLTVNHYQLISGKVK